MWVYLGHKEAGGGGCHQHLLQYTYKCFSPRWWRQARELLRGERRSFQFLPLLFFFFLCPSSSESHRPELWMRLLGLQPLLACIAPEKSPEIVNIKLCSSLPQAQEKGFVSLPGSLFPGGKIGPAVIRGKGYYPHRCLVKVSFHSVVLQWWWWGEERNGETDSLPFITVLGRWRLTLVAVSSWQESSLWPSVPTVWLLWHVASPVTGSL